MSEPHRPEDEPQHPENAGMPPMNWGGKEPVDEPFPEESTEPRGSRRRWILIGTAVVLAVLGAGIAGIAIVPHLPPVMRNLLPGAASSSGSIEDVNRRMAGLEQRVDDLDARMLRTRGDLESRIAANAGTLDMLQQETAAPAAEAGRKDIERRLTDLEAQIKSLRDAAAKTAAPAAMPGAQPTPAPVAPAASTALTDALDRRIGLLEQSLAAESRQRATVAERLSERLSDLAASSSGSARRVGLVLAIQRLAQSTSGSAGFADDVKMVRALAPAGPFAAPLTVLEGYAATGVPTRHELRGSFEALAANVVRAAAVPSTDTWWQRVLRRLASLVVVRRVGDVQGSTPDAVVARAEQRLNVGNLAGAVAELKALEGAPAKAAAGWVKGAEGRLAVEQAVSALREGAVAQLSDKDQPSGSDQTSGSGQPSGKARGAQ